MSLSTLNKNLSIFIPTYNEEHRIAETLILVERVCKKYLNEYEIIVINDGSTDKSLFICEQLKSKIGSLRIVNFSSNRGFGEAYLTGLIEAKFSHALYLTADGDVHEEELSLILKTWDGSRSLLQYSDSPSRGFFRRNLSRLFTFLVNFLSGNNWPYYNGFNIYKLDNVSGLKIPNLGFCTQALVVLSLLKRAENTIILKTDSKFNDSSSKSLTVKNFYYAFCLVINIIKRRYE